MSTRENQNRLDRLAVRYLAALDAEDFATVAHLWEQAAHDEDLGEMLHGLNAELVVEQDAARDTAQDAASRAIRDAIEETMPSAQFVRPTTGALTAAEVAEHIRRRPPAGLTVDDLAINDALRRVIETVPTQLGLSEVLHWGRKFGPAPEAYWRAFREVALDLWMQRTAPQNYKMAARPQRPQQPKRRGDGLGEKP